MSERQRERAVPDGELWDTWLDDLERWFGAPPVFNREDFEWAARAVFVEEHHGPPRMTPAKWRALAASPVWAEFCEVHGWRILHTAEAIAQARLAERGRCCSLLRVQADAEMRAASGAPAGVAFDGYAIHSAKASVLRVMANQLAAPLLSEMPTAPATGPIDESAEDRATGAPPAGEGVPAGGSAPAPRRGDER